MAEETTILLESGNNELELLEFKVKDLDYGINVAKVAEIINNKEITPVPESKAGVRGMLSLRDKVISVIDLNSVLFHEDTELSPHNIFIVTNFNGIDMAFIADQVNSIHRYRWSDVSKPDNIISNADTGIITGIVRDEGRLVCVLDFEKIVSDLDPSYSLKTQEIDEEVISSSSNRQDFTILIAEDSKMLNRLIADTLSKAGYHVVPTLDGLEAWALINECSSKKELFEKYQCLITDIEMPAMDGLTLSKNVKSDPRYSALPVAIFSSLVNDALIRKVESLNIDVMVTKPEIGLLVESVDKLILNKVF